MGTYTTRLTVDCNEWISLIWCRLHGSAA